MPKKNNNYILYLDLYKKYCIFSLQTIIKNEKLNNIVNLKEDNPKDLPDIFGLNS
jgi:hypothetical protein